MNVKRTGFWRTGLVMGSLTAAILGAVVGTSAASADISPCRNNCIDVMMGLPGLGSVDVRTTFNTWTDVSKDLRSVSYDFHVPAGVAAAAPMYNGPMETFALNTSVEANNPLGVYSAKVRATTYSGRRYSVTVVLTYTGSHTIAVAAVSGYSDTTTTVQVQTIHSVPPE